MIKSLCDIRGPPARNFVYPHSERGSLRMTPWSDRLSGAHHLPHEGDRPGTLLFRRGLINQLAVPSGGKKAHCAPPWQPQAGHWNQGADVLSMAPNDGWSLDFVWNQLIDAAALASQPSSMTAPKAGSLQPKPLSGARVARELDR